MINQIINCYFVQPHHFIITNSKNYQTHNTYVSVLNNVLLLLPPPPPVSSSSSSSSSSDSSSNSSNSNTVPHTQLLHSPAF